MMLSFMNVSYVSRTNVSCLCSGQKVEDTVEKLEAELAVLLDAMDAPEWRPLLDNMGKTDVDILDDPGQKLN